MAKQLAKSYYQFNYEPQTINEDEKTFDIYASTVDKDRYGDVIQPNAFQLDKIAGLPILLNHNPDKVIGKALYGRVNEKGLILKIKMTDVVQYAKDAWELVKAKLLTFASVGFIPESYDMLEDGGRLFTKVDLLETSLTPTPANSGAIMLCMKSVQDPMLKEEFEKQYEEIQLKENVNKLISDYDSIKDELNQLNEKFNQIELEKKDKEYKEQMVKTINDKLKQLERKLRY